MPNKEEQFIVCPVCNGSGKNKLGFACSSCMGMGLGFFSFGKFYYWKLGLSKAVIQLDFARRKLNFFLNLIAYVVFLTGVATLAIWLYFVSLNTQTLTDYFFWNKQHPLILIFWIGVIAGMFIFFRVSEESRKRRRIEKTEYEDRTNTRRLPDNWAELVKSGSEIRVEVSHGFDEKIFKVIEDAFLLAIKLGNAEVNPVHLFFAALSDNEVVAILSRLDTNLNNLIEKIKNYLLKIESDAQSCDLSNETKEVLISAYLEAISFRQKHVSVSNLLTALISKDEYLKELFLEFEITAEKIFNVVLWFHINEKMIENYNIYQKKAHLKPKTSMNRSYTAIATPILDSFGYDLTLVSAYGRLEFCVAREEELDNIFSTFEGGNNGVILVGATGVGKKTIVGGVAERMVREDVPSFMRDMRLVEIDASRIISGATPAQAEGRMLSILDEVISSGNIVLCVYDIEHLIGISSGEGGSLDLSEVLANEIERRNIYCLATAGSDNYTKYIERKTLGRAMKKIIIEEPEGDQAIQIVESKIGAIESHNKVYFSYGAIEKAISLSQRYIHDSYLPEKAINILNMTAVNTGQVREGITKIVENDVARTVSEITKIPLTKITISEGKELLHLEEKMHERMIGQNEAIEKVSASLRRARTELRENKRPIANFLFLGPTGVGKTELAKTIADVYFGDEAYMIRIDMSEYQHPDSVDKMIGNTDGVNGYLTEKVRKLPFSLILLDELEKAHPDILNLFLQVLDDGRLTDGQGRTIDFTNSIIIATSNAGASYIQDSIFNGIDIEEIRRVLIDEHLNKVMRPEFINRFDGVIVFEPLSMQNIVQIAHIMLKQIESMLHEKGIGFRVQQGGVMKLAQEGYDPKFGARPLRRVIQQRVEDAIANKILAGELKRRDVVVLDESAKIEVEKGVAL
ncbi:AAA family ATPase [Candidatus Parcubacteria bacterium]|nr:AAA family ATPase [Patescibacteria group bacterium]MBU4309091.1 AAA family ATPase [Patescibacteria group bacterium]MBU4432468.1 AAA family ATPase [Patescibacteria group bacterium]MBU4577452.1 AAA family ATPase [Patescibacteria group bacterium]MCG2697140.1 AAA family ATPase [Candidatus Parcubacteria bacterium]